MKLPNAKKGDPILGLTKEDIEKFKALVKRELFYKEWYSPEKAGEFARKNIQPKPDEGGGE